MGYGRKKIYISEELENTFIEEIHELLMHPGEDHQYFSIKKFITF